MSITLTRITGQNKVLLTDLSGFVWAFEGNAILSPTGANNIEISYNKMVYLSFDWNDVANPNEGHTFCNRNECIEMLARYYFYQEENVIVGGGGDSVWGLITGNINDQTDLISLISSSTSDIIQNFIVYYSGATTVVGKIYGDIQDCIDYANNFGLPILLLSDTDITDLILYNDLHFFGLNRSVVLSNSDSINFVNNCYFHNLSVSILLYDSSCNLYVDNCIVKNLSFENPSTGFDSKIYIRYSLINCDVFIYESHILTMFACYTDSSQEINIKGGTLISSKLGLNFDVTLDTGIWSNLDDSDNIVQGSTQLFVSSAEKSTWNGKISGTEKGSANGVATLDANSLIPVNQIPPSVIERLVIVANEAARFSLTTATVQNGDTVKQVDTKVMYFVKDDTNLNNANGYEIYNAGTAASVDWGGVTSIPSNVSTFGTSGITNTITTNLTGLLYGNGSTISAQTGTATRLAIFGSNNSLTDSVNLIWDNSNFALGVPIIKAISDGTTAIKINASNGTTNILTVDTTNTRIGFSCTPSYDISFYKETAHTIGIERSTTPSTAGADLTILAGSATSGGTNLKGGNVIISTGISTGNNTSTKIDFLVPTAGTTGTADKVPTSAYSITGSTSIVHNMTGTLNVGGAIACPQYYGASSYWNISGNFTPIWKLSNANINQLQFIGSSSSTDFLLTLDNKLKRIGLLNAYPQYDLSIDGTIARTIGLNRYAGNNTAGNNLTIIAGGANAGGAITSISVTNGGTGYTTGDILTVTTGGTNGKVYVTSVSAGVVVSVVLIQEGENYTTGAGKATSGGTGASCTLNIATVRTAATDKDGGMLYLYPGVSTGTGKSSVRMGRYSRATSTGAVDNTIADALILPSRKHLTDNTAIDLFEITLTTGLFSGGIVNYSIFCTDGTEYQIHTGIMVFGAANKAGTVTCGFDHASAASGLEKDIATGGTITGTFAITAGTNKATVSLNANSSLTPTTLYIEYNVDFFGTGLFVQL